MTLLLILNIIKFHQYSHFCRHNLVLLNPCSKAEADSRPLSLCIFVFLSTCQSFFPAPNILSALLPCCVSDTSLLLLLASTLCISKSIKAPQVDHIVPRSKGGLTALENLQAICYTRNAQKQNKDNTDFRDWPMLYYIRDKECIFCAQPKAAIKVIEDITVQVSLAIPARQSATFYSCEMDDKQSILDKLVTPSCQTRKVGKKDNTCKNPDSAEGRGYKGKVYRQREKIGQRNHKIRKRLLKLQGAKHCKRQVLQPLRLPVDDNMLKVREYKYCTGIFLQWMWFAAIIEKSVEYLSASIPYQRESHAHSKFSVLLSRFSYTKRDPFLNSFLDAGIKTRALSPSNRISFQIHP